jgi:hypothetical protein
VDIEVVVVVETEEEEGIVAAGEAKVVVVADMKVVVEEEEEVVVAMAAVVVEEEVDVDHPLILPKSRASSQTLSWQALHQTLVSIFIPFTVWIRRMNKSTVVNVDDSSLKVDFGMAFSKACQRKKRTIFDVSSFWWVPTFFRVEPFPRWTLPIYQ